MTIWDDRFIVQPGLRPDGRYLSLQAQFEEWLASPDGQFMEGWLLDKVAVLRSRGFRHYGIASLWEVARYSRDIAAAGAVFKANNNYRSRMARHLMSKHPDLDGFFSTRELTA